MLLNPPYLLVNVQLPENLRGVEKMLILKDPSTCQYTLSKQKKPLFLLLCIVSQERQIQENCQPVAVDEEEHGEEAMDSSFRDDVGVETVAEINGVDIITVGEVSC
jgi:hypothetical protein